MNVLSYSDTRARLKEVMDRVVEDHDPVVITRRSGEAVVMVSLSDWQAMEETTYLNASPANAKRLRESIAELNAGEGVERDLIKP
ncbi:MAG TPA: type II toxin-antitoxin system prevent-host-death family antitoxin [Caulobacteraceae bacterium]|nr:type II toxin-antitoxin system prevent-host-death family antitoxin [Caulobacteraceae bacterium]